MPRDAQLYRIHPAVPLAGRDTGHDCHGVPDTQGRRPDGDHRPQQHRSPVAPLHRHDAESRGGVRLALCGGHRHHAQAGRCVPAQGSGKGAAHHQQAARDAARREDQPAFGRGSTGEGHSRHEGRHGGQADDDRRAGHAGADGGTQGCSGAKYVLHERGRFQRLQDDRHPCRSAGQEADRRTRRQRRIHLRAGQDQRHRRCRARRLGRYHGERLPAVSVDVRTLRRAHADADAGGAGRHRPDPLGGLPHAAGPDPAAGHAAGRRAVGKRVHGPGQRAAGHLQHVHADPDPRRGCRSRGAVAQTLL